MVGLSGTVIFDKDNDSVAIGIVPNHNKVETVTVQSIGPDGIKTEKETIRPDRDTLLYTCLLYTSILGCIKEGFVYERRK